ncbi:hypothetical protein FNU76_01540 [Chitinimonas arctica]|uniref:Uncharacterized protein n=1 Tax=Chitinimonas arctica TaxID=2594795 RepID=A0A516SAH1_9NEIS|nr:hypothetical protein [Chitinimonas arctica]QDQ25143.1 hypothetical protein FNU76_01540 [Chitinimonas arctica]
MLKSKYSARSLLACLLLSLPLSALADNAAVDLQAPKMSKEQAEKFLDDKGLSVAPDNLPSLLMNAHVEEVVAMLEMGIDPNGKILNMPQTSIEFAAMACQDKSVETRRVVQVMDALLSHGANPNQPGMQGLGPMLTAAQQCPGMVVERLVKGGGDINSRSYQGFTPLSMALAVKNYDAAETLVRLGARLKPETGKKFLEGTEVEARMKSIVGKAIGK